MGVFREINAGGWWPDNRVVCVRFCKFCHGMTGKLKPLATEPTQSPSEVVNAPSTRSDSSRANSPPAKEGCPKGGVVASSTGNPPPDNRRSGHPERRLSDRMKSGFGSGRGLVALEFLLGQNRVDAVAACRVDQER